MDKKRALVSKLIEELIAVPETETREDEIISIINNNVSDPEWMDYIFHSSEYANLDGSCNIEALVEKIFNYKPVTL